MAAASFWRIMHLILCSTIDLKKHTTEVTYGRAEFLYMVVVRGLHVDMASFIYQSVCVEALKTDDQISLPYGVLLTQFLHNLMVPEGADEPRAFPLGSINKTTLSKSMAKTRRVLSAARAVMTQTEMMLSIPETTEMMLSTLETIEMMLSTPEILCHFLVA
ncbi:hypothetical protein CJ030_MR8G020275 [Morella rubra]|uniref:Uncharacterized protein n=1 Tax=Morella rubra TaxID=262757 RepID=A0A6A1UQG9_9ROSI|nr:hypothetical protein CJ030_MR8G020275 [Morella rubra]